MTAEQGDLAPQVVDLLSRVKAVSPQTPEEWQTAVDAAEGALALDSCRQYGLVTGGPKVNVNRCCEIIDAGRKRGIVPSPDAVQQFVAALQTHAATD